MLTAPLRARRPHEASRNQFLGTFTFGPERNVLYFDFCPEFFKDFCDFLSPHKISKIKSGLPRIQG